MLVCPSDAINHSVDDQITFCYSQLIFCQSRHSDSFLMQLIELVCIFTSVNCGILDIQNAEIQAHTH